MAGNCTYPKLTPTLRAASNARRAALPSLVPPLTGDQTLPVSGQDHHGSDRALASRLLHPRDRPLPHSLINPASAKSRCQRFNARIHEPIPSLRVSVCRESTSALRLGRRLLPLLLSCRASGDHAIEPDI